MRYIFILKKEATWSSERSYPTTSLYCVTTQKTATEKKAGPDLYQSIPWHFAEGTKEIYENISVRLAGTSP
jgi:hypothetical protein